MPLPKKGYQNTSGVSRQTADGVFYANGRYLCQRIVNGVPCNREIAGTTHSISSHNSDFHKPGRYQQLMARGEYKCAWDGCNHQSANFQAILGHIRTAHKFRGSSDPLKRHYGIPVGAKRKADNEVEGNRHKKQSRQNTPQTIKEDDREETCEDTRLELEENHHQERGEESEDDGNDDDDYLNFIDPLLRKWDKDNGGPGSSGAGSGGSGLGGQLLSSNVIAASG